METFLLALIIDASTPGIPAWEGTVDLSLFKIYGDMIEGLWPIAVICAISLLCTAVWLLAAGAHLRSGSHGSG